MSAAQDDEKPPRNTLWVTVSFLVVFVLWLATPAAMKHFYPELTNRGLAGDMFGGINALFSGLALAGVVMAILLQRQELALQREELRETRKEMTRTADAQEAAHQALQKTIWAQSFKVAQDILDSEVVNSARRHLIGHAHNIKHNPRLLTDTQLKDSAERVCRAFAAVATMIRKGLLPKDYILDTWSVKITEQWDILEGHMETLRQEGEFIIALDFTNLAEDAVQHIKEHALIP